MGIDQKNPVHLYKQVVEDIKSKILHKELKNGDSIGSQQVLSKFYNVSSITIRKAIAELINEGIVYSRMGKGTYVQRAETNKKLVFENAIGFVLRDFKNPLFSLIVNSVEESAARQGWNLILSNTMGNYEKEDKQIQYFIEAGVKGLVIVSSYHIHKATDKIRKLHQQNFPYVMISYVEDEDIYYVGTDHKHGASLAAHHLISLGYKRIAYICGQKGNVLSELRLKSFAECLIENGIQFTDKSIFQPELEGHWDHYKAGYNVGEKYSEMDIKPEAVFTYNDLCALGFEQAILDQGLKIPDDVAIIGFDNIKRDVEAQVPLTTINQPTKEIGKLALDILLKRINGESVEKRTILKPELIIRESCGT